MAGVPGEAQPAPPHDAQRMFRDCGTRPDFHYEDSKAVIYVDSPPHDHPERQRQDALRTDTMKDAGNTIVRFTHADDWHELTAKFTGLFGHL